MISDSIKETNFILICQLYGGAGRPTAEAIACDRTKMFEMINFKILNSIKFYKINGIKWMGTLTDT